MADEPRQLVTVSCETTALTTLPDALIDDDTISPLAKMAYWYLKRHGGYYPVGQLAKTLTVANAWPLVSGLRKSGWISYPTQTMSQYPQFTVHEVPAVKR